MKVAVLALVLGFAAPQTAVAAPADCDKTYTRAHFHRAARSTFSTAFPSLERKRTLRRVVRCQRRVASRPIVRRHRRLYRHAWMARFRFVRAWARVEPWLKDVLVRIAACESHGNPVAISPDGRYRGKYQFDFTTWRSAGGRGDPAEASEREQDVRAANLYRWRGVGPWPVCA